jgi:hypothetical protein
MFASWAQAKTIVDGCCHMGMSRVTHIAFIIIQGLYKARKHPCKQCQVELKRLTTLMANKIDKIISQYQVEGNMHLFHGVGHGLIS